MADQENTTPHARTARPLAARVGRWMGIITILLAVFALGFLVRGGCAPAQQAQPHATTHAEEPAPTEVWTCSMHPQIRRPKPGLCPICNMDLILATSDAGDLSERRFETSAEAEALMDIRTAPVERKFVAAQIRMVGKVDYDETSLRTITAWIPGRLDRLFVDYTGIAVRQGDHMVEIYSPELLGAQAELIQAVKTVAALPKDASDFIRESTENTLAAVREKLRLWGLTPEQIAEIERRGTPADRVTIYAPMAGIVVQKHANQGDYVKTGTPIYTVADLSRVWVKLDAYESDLTWLRYGQAVSLQAEAYPGETFEGRIAFIDPVLNPKTRTVRIRVNASNPEGKLKPNLFIRATVQTRLAKAGRVMDPDLAGKWISPMHPEIVKDAPGDCDVCGMPLVRAEELGYVSADPAEAEAPLVIPASAPLITGKRAVVYVKIEGAGKPIYEGREIELGPRAGDYYLVASGLTEGEWVVTRGNFKIDSALQIQAKPSMMSLEDGVAPAAHHGSGTKTKSEEPPPTKPPLTLPEGSEARLRTLWESYEIIQSALADDDQEKSSAAAQPMIKAVADIDRHLKEYGQELENLDTMRQTLQRIAGAKDIEDARSGFRTLSNEMIAIAHNTGVGLDATVYRLHCPMAFDNQGADWLQDDKEVRNPYFGKVMLRCGEVVWRFPKADGSETKGHDHD